MKASSKMRSRPALMQSLPMLMEMAFNPALLEMNRQIGIVPNMDTLNTVIADMVNMQKMDFWRSLTPQEQQALNQPSPDQALRAQMQQEREAGTAQRQEAGDETKILIELLKRVITPDVAHEVLGMDAPAAIVAKHAPKPSAGGSK
jgi:hypothetical protein